MPGGAVEFTGERMRRTCVLALSPVLIPAVLCAAPKPDLWPRWQTNNPASTVQVDHTAWAQFLWDPVNS